MNSIAHPAPTVSGTPYDRCECGHVACTAFDAALPKAHAEIQAACQHLLEQIEDCARVLREVIADPSRAPELLEAYAPPYRSSRYGVLESDGERGLDWALARLEEAQPESEVQP